MNDQDRERRRDYENDVFYDVWRSGRNPDSIDYGRVADSFWSGEDAEATARREIRIQDDRRQRLREEQEQCPEPFCYSCNDAGCPECAEARP